MTEDSKFTEDQPCESSGTAVADGPLEKTLRRIRRVSRLQPKLGLVLGSGLGSLSESIERDCEIPYSELPGLPCPRAPGHAGRLLLGHLAGLPVAVMQGRCHLYEGWSPDHIAFPVQILAGLGVHHLLTTCAAGGLNPQLRVGDLMLLSDHLDLQFQKGARSCQLLQRPHALKTALPGRIGRYYCPQFSGQVQRAAGEAGLRLQEGVYSAVTGPNFETRAEIRFFSRFADAVGMSVIPEVLTGWDLGLSVAGVAVITNLARPDRAETTDSEHVLQAAAAALPSFQKLLRHLARRLLSDPG